MEFPDAERSKSYPFVTDRGEIYPDKEIIPVNGEILAVIGGGIHCVTQQQPSFIRIKKHLL